MTVGEIAAFLLVAQGETKDGGGLTVEELMKAGEFALSSASRYSNGLAEKDRNGNPGKQLISNLRDPADDRRKVLRLTPKGQRLVQLIGQAIA
jgi:DNA-binding MarR family transcriptional regulator